MTAILVPVRGVPLRATRRRLVVVCMIVVVVALMIAGVHAATYTKVHIDRPTADAAATTTTVPITFEP